MDRDLPNGECYTPFEQLGPDRLAMQSLQEVILFTTFVQHERLPSSIHLLLHLQIVLENIPHLKPIAKGIHTSY